MVITVTDNSKFKILENLIIWFWFFSSQFSLLLSEESVKDPIQKYVTVTKATVQYYDNLFQSLRQELSCLGWSSLKSILTLVKSNLDHGL